MRFLLFFVLLWLTLLMMGCERDDAFMPTAPEETDAGNAVFGGSINLADPLNYAAQATPNYVRRDNTGANPVTDLGATLGRVLFYDKKLSADETISCASCHRQELAFGDDAVASTGVAGTTGRHGMRLTNARFGDETSFFWDERAVTLEAQTTQPIRDHVEMGFSGEGGDPDFAALVTRLENTDYYRELFTAVYGNATVTESRLQEALAQFIRSMESFDAKYDTGRAQVNNDGTPFPNFSEAENRGKDLFLRPPMSGPGGRVGGGLGCAGCHRPPEFSIDPNSGNNGVIGAIGGGQDRTVTRSPSLRDVFLPDGSPNGPFMHTGQFTTLAQVIGHYDQIPAANPGLDRRLQPGGRPQRLNMTDQERADLLAFLRTLTGETLFTDERWGNPFPD
ncbi:MAG: cytochrome c peroxidase [Bacteroidota bacterium]